MRSCPVRFTEVKSQPLKLFPSNVTPHSEAFEKSHPNSFDLARFALERSQDERFALVRLAPERLALERLAVAKLASERLEPKNRVVNT